MTVLGLPRPELEAYVDRRELARLMGVHPDTIKRWKRKGMPHTVFMSRTVRYRPSLAIAWARENSGQIRRVA